LRSARLLALCLLSYAIILSAWAADQPIYNASISEYYLNALSDSHPVKLANNSQIEPLDSDSSSLDSNNYLDYLIKEEGRHNRKNDLPYYPDTFAHGNPFDNNIISIKNIQLLINETSSSADLSQYCLYEDDMKSVGFQARKGNSGNRAQGYAYAASRSSEMALGALAVQDQASAIDYGSISCQAYSFDASEMKSTLKYVYEKNPYIDKSMSGFAAASPAILLETDPDLKYDYEEKIAGISGYISGPNAVRPVILPEAETKLRYIQKSPPHESVNGGDIQNLNPDFKPETNLMLDHIRDSRDIQDNDKIEKRMIANHGLLSILASSASSSGNRIDAGEAFNASISALNNFHQIPSSSHNIWRNAAIQAPSSKNVKYLGSSIFWQVDIPESAYRPIITPSSDFSKMLEHAPLDESKGASRTNYAIVVGINSYADRVGLQTCINDANLIASILESYGYEIIKLTDETTCKPTKHNIDDALAEIRQKQNCGNVIFYFSGHGLLDDKGNFYLVPLDAHGASSSYISKEDFRQYSRDIKNLAIIIDACNSGALCDVTEDGQLMIASSKEKEPSNEEWIGSLSVFTSSLCDAINEEHKKGSKVLLQDCFSAAYYATVDWSKKRLFIDQTPLIEDRTSNKRYYLN
jgi:hypothetical protein